MKTLKKALSLFLTLIIISATAQPAHAETAAATTLRLAGSSGTVSITNASGKAQTVKTDMRLYNGYALTTGKQSSAFVSLDGTKAVKLDASSKASVKKSGNKLEVCLDSGDLFFDVTAPLAADESLNIRTSTMVTGIRGSFGWVTNNEVALLHGHVTLTCINPVSGAVRVTELYSGEKVYYDPDSTVAADPELKEIDFIKEIVTNDDVPSFVVEEIRDDESLQEALIEDVPSIDVPKLLEDYEEKKAAEDEEIETREQELEEELEQQEQFIEEDPVDYLFDEDGVYGVLQYDGNGATGGAVPSQTSEGEAIMVSANGFTRAEDYYIFSGWNTAADGSGDAYAPGDAITPEGTVTLYAQWQAHPDEYTELVTLLSSAETDVYIDADITYTAALGELQVSGTKILHIPAGVTVSTTDEVTYVAGGSLTVTGGGTMIAAGVTISCTLTVEDGTLTVNGDLLLKDAESVLIVGNGGTVNVTGSLTLEVLGAAATIEGGGSLTAPAMDNTGSVSILAGGTFDITGSSTNSGTIENSGTASFAGTLINYGDITSDGDLTVEGLDNSGMVTNTGTFHCTRECWGEGGYDIRDEEGNTTLEYIIDDGRVVASIVGDTVTVRGTGRMEKILIPYLGGVTKAVVEEGITSLNFNYFTSLKTISFPSTLEALEEGAFYHCDALTQIDLPDVITVISSNAFANSGLKSIVLSESVTSLGSRAFWDCSDLSEITLPDGLESLEYAVFEQCTSLTYVYIPDSVTTMGSSIFMGCGSLKSVHLPSGLTEIGGDFFRDCSSLETVEIPAGVTTIESQAFINCYALTEITLPVGVTSIGYRAFQLSGLQQITIPASVTEIYDNAFYGCSSLVTINFGGTMEVWEAVSSIAAVPSGVTVVCSDGTITP